MNTFFKIRMLFLENFKKEQEKQNSFHSNIKKNTSKTYY